jgi:hypothetical protein
MSVVRRYNDNGRIEFHIEATGSWVTLNDLHEWDRTAAYPYLSGTDLRKECDYTTERSKELARMGQYEEAKKFAEVADELEMYIEAGGKYHR